MDHNEEKGYSIYALISGSYGHVIYSAESARAVYRDHRNGKYRVGLDLFAGAEKVEMYKLEELRCTQQMARIRRGVWSLWLHRNGYLLVSEAAREQAEAPDPRDEAAAKRIRLKPEKIFVDKNDLSNGWTFTDSRRTLSFTVSVEEYADACHQAADAGVSLSEHCRERYYGNVPERQSISELCRCLQQAETAGRLADALVKQGVLAHTDPRDYEKLAVEISALCEATSGLAIAIRELIGKENGNDGN